MSNTLAYHVVVNALEARAGWTPASRFASAVAHAINGHLPYHRYHAAGTAKRRDDMGEGALEAIVRDFMATDLAPGMSLMRRIRHESVSVAGYNAYNSSAKLGVITRVELSGSAGNRRCQILAARESVAKVGDPHLCRVGTLLMFDALLACARDNARLPLSVAATSLGSVADLLGVAGSAAAEAALVFDAEGHLTIVQLAGRLGCHQRTLERRLKESGLTPEMLRQASRLIRATGRLWSQDSLTTIATEEGFSDLSHMTRSFQTAGGMAPSALRSLARADLAASTLANS